MARTHITHRWAHNTDTNRSGRYGAISFDGNVLYSFATVIAVKYPEKHTVVFANRGIRNSGTTMRHKQLAVRALDKTVWKIVWVDCDQYGTNLKSIPRLKQLHKDKLATIKAAAKQVMLCKSAPSKMCAFKALSDQVADYNALSEFLGRKTKATASFFTPDQQRVLEDAACKYQAFRDKIDATRAAQEAIRRRQRQEWAKAEIEKERESAVPALWRNHEWQGNAMLLRGTYLRVSKSGKHVESSKGVVVELGDALKLFKMCRFVHDHPDISDGALSLLIAGKKVGCYDVRSIDKNGSAVVGCHELQWEEMAMCFDQALSRGLIPKSETTTTSGDERSTPCTS